MTILTDKMGEQPIFTCRAHVFHIDPKTKRSWIPASGSAVAVSFFYDSSRALYRIISVEGTKAVINSTITPNMTFTKTSQKFGQWSDVRANTVYGLGFSSESELNKFIEKFAEVKEATRAGKANGSGTTPTTSANASPVTSRAGKEHNDNVEHFAHNQNDAVNSNLTSQLKQQLTIGSESPKKLVQEKGGVPPPSMAGDSQLKYENDRLKLALAQSSANAKKWEVELSTLKNNNARLTSALQESTSNVEEWKRQLHSYKEDNTRLKMNLLESEAGRGNCDYDAAAELRELRANFEDLERELGEKNEEMRKLRTEGGGRPDPEEMKSLQVENEGLKLTLDKTQSQLDTSLDAQEQQRKVLETINRQFGDYLHHMGQLQNELTQVLNT